MVLEFYPFRASRWVINLIVKEKAKESPSRVEVPGAWEGGGAGWRCSGSLKSSLGASGPYFHKAFRPLSRVTIMSILALEHAALGWHQGACLQGQGLWAGTSERPSQ